MVEKKYSRKEPDLAASYAVVREFYAKEEFYARFFERLTKALSKQYGQERAAEILKSVGNPRVKIRGFEEFLNAKQPYDLGTRAYNRVKSRINSTAAARYLEECEELKEEILVKGYKNINITSVLINATKVIEKVEEGLVLGEALAKLFCTYNIENPFFFDFYAAGMVGKMDLERNKYAWIMTNFINTLMELMDKKKIPYGRRVQSVHSDPRYTAMFYLKDKFRALNIKKEINEIFKDVEEFGTDSYEELRAYEKLAELLDKPYIYAHWLKDHVAKILSITPLKRFTGVHERTSHFNKDYYKIPYTNLVHVTQEDVYLAVDSIKVGDYYHPYIDIEYNCNNLSVEAIERTLDNLILLSIAKERLWALNTSNTAVHRVILTDCTNFTKEFLDKINLRTRKIASKYNKEVEVQVLFHKDNVESKSGLGTPEYLRVISDMHVDVNMERDYEFDFGEDFVVNAGDTSGNWGTTSDWVSTHMLRGILVAGNHLGYDSKYSRRGIPAYANDDYTKVLESKSAHKDYLEKCFPVRDNSSINFLENRFIEKYGIYFWGSELKSDFKIFGEENQAACMAEAGRCINDFRRCVKLKRDDTKPEGQRGVVSTYSPQDHLEEFNDAIGKLNKQLLIMQNKGPDTPVVLVTHFVPSMYGVAERYKSDPITAAFASDLSWVVEKFPNVRLWVSGHCIDDKTEILTPNGWKSFSEIHKETKVLNLNKDNNVIEEDTINRVISKKYSGDVYYFKSRGVDIRVTEDHTMLDLRGTKNKTYVEVPAKEFAPQKYKNFINSGVHLGKGINLSEGMLRLLVWIAADGSKNNKDLIRFRLWKERKIERLQELLNELQIPYRFYKQKSGVSINFTLPKELSNCRLKPIDSVITKCNQRQCEVILEEYANTDGSKSKTGMIRIYTSKKEEADILQQMCVTNGYTCSCMTRVNQGFKLSSGKEKVSYELSTYKHQYVRTDNRYKNYSIEHVKDEHFWCVSTKNQTIITRRNGKVVIIGNCHTPYDFIYKQCRFVCNPFGYFNENNVDIENYGVRIKLSDIRSDKSWTQILKAEIASGLVKIYN